MQQQLPAQEPSDQIQIIQCGQSLILFFPKQTSESSISRNCNIVPFLLQKLRQILHWSFLCWPLLEHQLQKQQLQGRLLSPNIQHDQCPKNPLQCSSSHLLRLLLKLGKAFLQLALLGFQLGHLAGGEGKNYVLNLWWAMDDKLGSIYLGLQLVILLLERCDELLVSGAPTHLVIGRHEVFRL